MSNGTNGGKARDDDRALQDERQWRQVAQRIYEPDRDGGLTTTIVFTIAEAEAVDPSDLKSPPLYEVVDTAGIEDTFFGLQPGDGSRQGTGTVEFHYRDYRVKVGSDGWVQVYETADPETV